jgi:hypothetical protein
MALGKRRNRIDYQIDSQFREILLLLTAVELRPAIPLHSNGLTVSCKSQRASKHIPDGRSRNLVIFGFATRVKYVSMAISCAKQLHRGVVDRHGDRKAPIPRNRPGDTPGQFYAFNKRNLGIGWKGQNHTRAVLRRSSPAVDIPSEPVNLGFVDTVGEVLDVAEYIGNAAIADHFAMNEVAAQMQKIKSHPHADIQEVTAYKIAKEFGRSTVRPGMGKMHVKVWYGHLHNQGCDTAY